ncbi:exodeoxyribonuclease V subunit beta [Prevotella sp. P6B4]|uniref:UvrD-helicase domain-containing protein n=1 Tax=Prevotella sp. P6B4 TaxID=1410614 RepID=UPI0004907FCD|nr:UvrD-helicase domain-containing protein [Prevotella sp. P6B4]
MVNETQKSLTVYKASAGSGKTFTLATEYIRLLVENPQSYRNILAVTFTNKATEEMKMRILSQLYGIWKQLPESDNYLQNIQAKTGLKPEVISERAGLALNNLTHNYNYFRVETIDTFFQSVLRNMARELDLTTNLRIGLNDYQVEELAVDQLIEDLTTTDVMLQWILKYIMENISDDKSWNVIAQIKKFGQNIFKDYYKEVSLTLEQKMGEEGFFENYTNCLRELRHSTEEHMKEIGESFFDTLEGEGLTPDDLSNKQRGIASFFNKLRRGDFDPSIVNTTVANHLENPEKWCAKTHPKRDIIIQLAESTLGEILRYAVDAREQQWKVYQSANLTLRHLNQLRLLSSIEKKVRELNETDNRFLLSDTQQLLHSLIDGSDSPFIFEKIGTQLKHVMIDEFQDTSTIQWQNFKVLLSETMSHEDGSNLIVGDVKQSIYRWRSGDWRLLNGIEHQFNAMLMDIKSLSTNYRSTRNVIEFNNQFFTHAANLEYAALEELNCDERDQLKKAYADVTQQVPESKPQEGRITIELLPNEEYQEEVLAHMTDNVSQLIDQGVSQKDIAILVRYNFHIPIIARYFLEHLPEVSIVSDEAFRLDASGAVCLMIQALQLLLTPDDQLTKAAIVKTWLCTVQGKELSDNEFMIAGADLDAYLPEAYIAHFDELSTLPLYELAEKIYAIFELHRLEGQGAYLCAFYDQLANYVNENTTDIQAFLTEWEESLCKKTIQSDETNGIRLISIHKSKGLEFDHVIIPFCDWPLEKTTDNIIWCQPDEAPFNDLPIVPIDYSQKAMIGTIYEGDYLHEHLQNMVDNLNLLYVAFTRAAKSLFVIGKRGAKTSRSALIELCLPLVAGDMPDAQLEGMENNDATIVFSMGSFSIGPTAQEETAPSQNPFLQKSEAVHVAIRNFESKVNFRQSNRSRDFIEGDELDQQHRYIQAGSVLHEIFSTIQTEKDIPEALQRLQFEGILYDEEMTANKITTMLRKRLADPRVASWFSSRWTLFNECTILSVEDGEVKEHRPDRVMTDGNEWIVVDFKFGHPNPDYHAQVRRYMDLLQSMGHQNIKGYLWYVYSNKIEEV